VPGHSSDREGDRAHIAVELDDVGWAEVGRNENEVAGPLL
jgi:hypothetical protein